MDFGKEAERARDSFFKALGQQSSKSDLVEKCQSWSTLTDVQKDGVLFMLNACFREQSTKGCILAHDMGVGKTAQAVTFLDGLLTLAEEKQMPLKALVLCPASLLQHWLVELNKWAPQISTIDLHGVDVDGVKIALYLWCVKGGTLLLSYNRFYQLFKPDRDDNSNSSSKENSGGGQAKEAESCHFDKLFTDIGPDVLICDEAELMCRDSAKTINKIRALATPVRVVLTASPLQNSLTDLHHLADFVCPHILGEEACFRENFINVILAGSAPGASKQLVHSMHCKQFILGCVMEKIMQRVDCSHLDSLLPPKTDMDVFIDASEDHRAAYNKYIANYGASSATGFFEKCNNLKRVLFDDSLLEERLRQELIANVEDEPPPQSSKQQLVLAIVDECIRCLDKIVVFSHHLDFLKRLEAILHKRYKTSVTAFFHGNIRSETKNDILKRFNNRRDELQVLLMSVKAGGIGLNLNGANRAVILDVSWNPTVDEQCARRIYRHGQTKRTYVYRIVVRNSIEQRILEWQQSKDCLFMKAVDQRDASSPHLSLEARSLFMSRMQPPRKQQDQQSAQTEDHVLRAVAERLSRTAITWSAHNSSIVVSEPTLTDVEKCRCIEEHLGQFNLQLVPCSSSQAM